MELVLLLGAVWLVMKYAARTVLAYVGGEAQKIRLGAIGDGFFLREDAAAAFNRMLWAAREAGVDLQVDSAFRTWDEQDSLYDKFLAGTGNLAAKPGFSNHQSGIAVDIIVGASFDSPTYRWLAANAPTFGFINTGATFKTQKEPWHWEFTG